MGASAATASKPAGLRRGVPGARGGVLERRHVNEIQRSRLLTGAVGAVEQHGYPNATVNHITHRAGVSRRTFYELFQNREDCLAAMFEDALERTAGEIAAAGVGELPWRERLRGSLLAILSFFDREPVLARVCVVQAMRGDERILERRAEILAQLAAAIDAGRDEGPRGASLPALTAEGLIGAAQAIVYDRLRKREPLTGLLGDLMAMIVLPYLGPDAARREQARPLPEPVLVESGRQERESAAVQGNPLESIPMRITFRTVLVLERIGAQPGISNREVADQAGIGDQGQVSKLLSRLERLGLVANTGIGHSKGERNAWRLTPTGQRVTQSVLGHMPNHRDAA
jgi:AcrR family transcriptional regulator/DNA-binding MarR family transcriptional regulator